MAYPVTVQWLDDEGVVINSPDELSALLGRIASEVVPPHFPLVQISSDDGCLSIGVGAPASTVSHVPANGDPPYLVSVGDTTTNDLYDFFYTGHHTQFHARNTVANHLAWAAAFEFAEKGVLTSKIKWEQC